jgi:hypothetical protein
MTSGLGCKVRGIWRPAERRDKVARRIFPSSQPFSGMLGLKPVFLGLSLALVALGVAYAGLGARALARGEADAGVLLGLGLAAAAVGAAVWRLVGRMRRGH